MAKGIVRELDNLGRVVIPMEWRRELNINPKDPIEIIKNDNEIIIKKYTSGCYCCGGTKENLIEYKGLKICKNCLEKVNKLSAIILEGADM